MSDAPTVNTTTARLDLIRGDITIELGVVAGLLAIAHAFFDLSFDDEAADTMDKMKSHVRRALELTARLQRERQDAAATGEAAVEYRAQRGRGVAA